MVDNNQMTAEELSKLFKQYDKSHGDFIRWAEKFGVSISRNTVSRHVVGVRKVTAYVQIAYSCFFNSLEIPPAPDVSDAGENLC